MPFEAQPNYLGFAALNRQDSIPNALMKNEAIQGQRTNNRLGEQQVDLNEVAMQFREAVARGDMAAAMRLDPQAGMELMAKRDAMTIQQQQIAEGQRAEQTARATQINNIVDSHFTADVMADPRRMAEMAPQFVSTMKGYGFDVEPGFADGTPDEIAANIAEMRQGISGYLEPQTLFAPKEGIDPDTGQPVFFQGDDRGGPPQIMGGITPPPKSGMELKVNPDGSTTFRTGVTGGGDKSKKTQGSLEDTILKSDATLANLKRAGADYNPEFLTVQGAAKALKLWGKDKVGMLSDPDEKAWFSQYNKWKRNSYLVMNEEINRLTGAAMSELEAHRLRKSMIDPENDSPQQFIDKYNEQVYSLQMARARAHYYRTHGLTPPRMNAEGKLLGGDSWVVSINGVEALMESRAQELTSIFMEDVKDENAARQMAIGVVKQEFGQ